MHTKTLVSTFSFAALVASFGPPAPASAQVTYAPEPSAPLTAKDITARPPVLGMEPILYAEGGPLQFEVRSGALVLTQTPGWVRNNQPENKVLWSGSSGTESQKFSLVTTKDEERIEDGTGKTVWSQPIKPKLTLDFDRPGLVRLLDANGKELGSGPVNNEPHHFPQFLNGHRFTKGFSTTDHGVHVEVDVFDQQTAVYDGKYLLWSGPRPSNDGIQLGSSPGSQVMGIATSRYSAGSVIPFTVSKEVGSMDIADRDHRLLETVPTGTLRLTVPNNDAAFRKDIRNVWLFQPHVALTQADPLTPGQLYVQYHDANGNWVSGELVRADKVTRRFAGIQPSPAVIRQEMLEVRTNNLNEAGTFESSPDVEYGWSKSL